MKIYRSCPKETQPEVMKILRNISTHDASRSVFCNIGCAGIVLSRMLSLHSDLLHLKHDESKKKNELSMLEENLEEKQAALNAASEYEKRCRSEAVGLRKEAVAEAKRAKAKLLRVTNMVEMAAAEVVNIKKKLVSCGENIGVKYERLSIVMDAVGMLSSCGNFIAESLSRDADLLVVLTYATDIDVGTDRIAQ